MITKERAFTLASQWGSYIAAGDPGSCMYAFHFNDGRPVSETHRRECLRYLRAQKPTTVQDGIDLLQLIRWFAACPLRQEARTNA